MDIIHTIFSVVWFIFSCMLTGFVIWRKLRRERVDNEDKIFDIILTSSLMSIIVGRLVFIAFHFQTFGLDPVKWISFFQFPGVVGVVMLLAWLLVFWKLLRNEWKDAIEQVDYLSIGVAFFLFLLALGDLFSQVCTLAQSFLPGASVVMPFFDIKILIVSSLYVLIFGFLFLFLSNVEKNYRTFLWYRARRRSAQTGFVVASFLIAYGLFGFLLSWFMPMSMVILGVGIDPIVKLLVMLLGFVVLYVRSGRSFFRQS